MGKRDHSWAIGWINVHYDYVNTKSLISAHYEITSWPEKCPGYGEPPVHANGLNNWMNGGGKMLKGKLRGSWRETLPTLQFCLEPDLLTGLHKKEKQKSPEKKVCCVERFKLTKEKERAMRAGRHVFGHIPCLEGWLLKRPGSDECAGNPIALSVPTNNRVHLFLLSKHEAEEPERVPERSEGMDIYSLAHLALSAGWKALHRGSTLTLCTSYLEKETFQLKLTVSWALVSDSHNNNPPKKFSPWEMPVDWKSASLWRLKV